MWHIITSGHLLTLYTHAVNYPRITVVALGDRMYLDKFSEVLYDTA